jgi:hypothetical protein
MRKRSTSSLLKFLFLRIMRVYRAVKNHGFPVTIRDSMVDKVGILYSAVA